MQLKEEANKASAVAPLSIKQITPRYGPGFFIIKFKDYMSEITANQTSSVGAAWPPVIGSNERLRGFYDQTISSIEDATVFAKEYESYQNEVELNQQVSRLSLRAVVCLGAIPVLDSLGVTLEAAMPIKSNPNAMIVYAGWNAPDRVSDTQVLADKIDRLVHNVEFEAGSLRQGNLDKGTYSKRVLLPYTPEADKFAFVDRFTDLYDVFGYDQDDIVELLLNPDNTIAFLEHNGVIISTALAEKANIKLNDSEETIRIAEVTEAITRPEYRGRGLYQQISHCLVQSLLETNPEKLDVIYGESNLSAPGVLIAAHQNGRRFSYFDRAALGVNNTNFGILPQNFKVNDGVDSRRYNDFALSYFPVERLK